MLYALVIVPLFLLISVLWVIVDVINNPPKVYNEEQEEKQ